MLAEILELRNLFFKTQDGIQLSNSPGYKISPETCMLVVHLDSCEKKSGRYTCRAENRFGQVEDYLDLKIEGI